MTREVTGQSSPITVVLVDDQPVVRQGFALFMSNDPGIVVVGQADCGNRAVDVVADTCPQVVLLDIRMPNRDGLWATREILSKPCPPKVIVVTTFDLDEYVFAAIDLGVSGFLLKDAHPCELTAAVRSVVRGGVALSPSVATRLLSEFARRRPGVRTTVRPIEHGLSAREAEVVDLLAHGMTNNEIAEQLRLEASTVKTHIGNICKKIGVKSRVQIVVWAYQNGVAEVIKDGIN